MGDTLSPLQCRRGRWGLEGVSRRGRASPLHRPPAGRREDAAVVPRVRDRAGRASKMRDRYRDCGLEGLTDRSRRPYRHAKQLPDVRRAEESPDKHQAVLRPTPWLSSTSGAVSGVWNRESARGQGGHRLALDALPILAPDAGLPEDEAEELGADVAFVRIGNCENELTAHHELVLAAGEGTFEPQGCASPQSRLGAWSAPTEASTGSAILTVAPSSVGTSRPRATRTRSHSSTTSARSRRHASSVVPVATTPRSPRTVAANVPSGRSS